MYVYMHGVLYVCVVACSDQYYICSYMHVLYVHVHACSDHYTCSYIHVHACMYMLVLTCPPVVLEVPWQWLTAAGPSI